MKSSKGRLKKWLSTIKKQTDLIRTKLIVSFLVILIVPGSIIGYFAYETAKDEVREKITNGTKSSLTLVESNTNQFINRSLMNLNTLTDVVDRYSLDSEKEIVNEFMEYFVSNNEEIIEVTVGLEDGTFLGTPTNANSTFDPREEDWYITAQESDDTVFSHVVKSMENDEWIVRLSQKLGSDQGVVQLSMSLSSLTEAVKSTKLGDTGTMAILDKAGNIVTGTGFIFDAGNIKQGDSFPLATGNANTEEIIVTEIDLTMITELYEIEEPITGWTVIGLVAVSDYSDAAVPILQTVLIVLVIFIILGAILLVFTLRSILIPLKKLSRSTRNVRDGNLNEQVDIKRKDEIGLLAEDFNEMTASLRTVVQELKSASNLLTGSSQSIKESTEETTKSVEDVVNTIQESAETASNGVEAAEETAEAIGSMAKGIHSIVDSLDVISETVNKTDQDVDKGSETIANVKAQMDKILSAVQESSNMIVELSNLSNEAINMNSAIGNIAQQTNLLSLNASIEAARSGEHGRGFAVVANEILKLSDQSKEVAEGIDATIMKMIEIVEKATETMQGNVHNQLNQGLLISEEAANAFASIEGSTKQIVQQVQDISGVTNSISQGTQQVIQNITDLEKVTKLSADSAHTTSASAEEQMAAMQEIAAASENLADMAQTLDGLVKRFSL
ncbi:methyl-accepting chemotaxis protein [Gracilibacillus xinjiangensis]|uniref:Methyl-accepting chemotaxis protein n=1 Tax=Gracilibacillus xinjiangensis TaxID=1193282 RepID=A0ABV8WTD2_9BACI